MKSLRISGALGALMLILAMAANAADNSANKPPSGLAAYADKVLSEAYPAGEPGAAAIIIQDGKVVLRKGYGMANLELGVPVSPDMV